MKNKEKMVDRIIKKVVKDQTEKELNALYVSLSNRKKHSRTFRVVIVAAILISFTLITTLVVIGVKNAEYQYSLRIVGDFAEQNISLGEELGGKNLKEIYTNLSHDVPEINLVVPDWLPPNSVLKSATSENGVVHLFYTIGDGTVMLAEKSVENTNDLFKLPLSGNQYTENYDFEIMGRKGTYIAITLETGIVSHNILWDDGTTVYHLKVSNVPDETFSQIIHHLTIFH